MKIFTIVTNIPSPYRLHLFEELNRQLKEKGWALRVNFMSHGHKGRPDSWRNPKMGFEARYWRDYGRATYHFNPGLIWHLMTHRSDILLCGSQFDTVTGIGVSLLARARKKGAWTEGNTKTTGDLGGVKGFLKRLTFRRYDFFAVPGIEGKRYVHTVLGEKASKEVFLLPNLVDETRFKPRGEWPSDEIKHIRDKLHCSGDNRLCIIPARLEWYKGLQEMFALTNAAMLSNWRFVIIGGGSLKDILIAQLQKQGILERVVFLDQVAYVDMPKYYAAADLFLLPSLMDRNPLSVVEALHSGLPVAVSDRCGNVDEAVDDVKNGWVLHVLDQVKFASELRTIFATENSILHAMGALGRVNRAVFWDTKGSISSFLTSCGC